MTMTIAAFIGAFAAIVAIKELEIIRSNHRVGDAKAAVAKATS